MIEWQTLKITPDIVHEYNIRLKKNRVPLIIDNGKRQPLKLVQSHPGFLIPVFLYILNFVQAHMSVVLVGLPMTNH